MSRKTDKKPAKPASAERPAWEAIADAASARRRELQAAAVAALLLSHFLLAFLAARTKSLTFDEHAHLTAGAAYLLLGDGRLNPEHPPLAKCLAALPTIGMGLRWNPQDPFWLQAGEWPALMGSANLVTSHAAIKHSIEAQWGFARDFLYDLNRGSLPRLMDRTRVVMAALSALGGLALYLWTRRAAGGMAGLAALALWSFCPNLLAHAPLANTDLCVTVFSGATLWASHEFLASPAAARQAWRSLAALSAALAAALLSKHTAFLLLPFIGLSLAASVARAKPRLRRRLLIDKTFGLFLALAGALALMVLFYGILYRDWTLRHFYWSPKIVSAGFLFNAGHQAFMLSTIQERFYSYFAVVALVKMTLPSFALVAAGAALTLRRRAAWRDPLLRHLWIYLVFMFAMMSLKFLNVGVRHMLPLWPAAFMLAALGLRGALASPRWPRIVVVAALAWHAAEAVIAFPNYISYMNEITLAKGKPYYLTDSNLDWGQDLPALGRYMKAQNMPTIKTHLMNVAADESFYGIVGERVTGEEVVAARPGMRLAVSVFFLQGDPKLRAALESWNLEVVLNDTIYVFRR